MASVDVYVPVYMVGADGTKAYQFAKLTGTLSLAKVPEGEICLSSRTMTTTPAAAKQPKPST